MSDGAFVNLLVYELPSGPETEEPVSIDTIRERFADRVEALDGSTCTLVTAYGPDGAHLAVGGGAARGVVVYATFDNEMDQLTGLGGSDVEPWWLHTNTEYYNDNDFGGWWAHNAAFDGVIPFLHYDSYWTIGTDDSAAGADLGIAFPGVQPTWDATDWYADDGGARLAAGFEEAHDESVSVLRLLQGR